MRVAKTFTVELHVLEALDRRASERGQSVSETVNEILSEVVVKGRKGA